MSGLQYQIQTSPSVDFIQQCMFADVRNLTKEGRRLLADGPTTSIHIGNEFCAAVPTRALMAFSNEINYIFTNKQNEDNAGIAAFAFNPSQVPKVAVEAICNFIKGNCYTMNTFNLKPCVNWTDTLKLYRAGRLLGWNKNNYLRGIFLNLLAHVHDVDRFVVEPKTIEQLLKLPTTDPIYQQAAVTTQILCHKNRVQNQAEFQKFIKQAPEFLAEMQAFSAKMEKLREETKERNKAIRAAKEQGLKPKYEEVFPGLGEDGLDYRRRTGRNLPDPKAQVDRQKPLSNPDESDFDWRIEAAKRNGLI